MQIVSGSECQFNLIPGFSRILGRVQIEAKNELRPEDGHREGIARAYTRHVEIPWDFARHDCDASYRPAIEAVVRQARHTLGQRIRRLRISAGLSQDVLARASGIGRVKLARLEKGEQSPRYKTLGAIAKALGVGDSELLAEWEILQQQVSVEVQDFAGKAQWIAPSGTLTVKSHCGTLSALP